MYANVISINIRGNLLVLGGVEFVTQLPLQLTPKALLRPALLKEKVLQARTLSVFTQCRLLAEQFSDATHDLDCFFQRHEGVKPNAKMGVGRQTATDTQRKTSFPSALPYALGGSQCDIVDLGIRAPASAASGRDLKFARQIVESRIARQLARYSLRDGRCIEDLVAGHSRERAASHVTHYIAARSLGSESHGGKRVHRLDQALNCQPVQLDVLPHSDVGEIAGVFPANFRYGAQLM